MQIFRRVSQSVFFTLFVVLFFFATYPLITGLPVDLFLRIDPLLAVTAIISSRSFIIKLIPALVILVLTVLLGRFFCGWICPLGSIVDWWDNRNRKAKRNDPKLKWLKYAILSAVLAGTLVSVQLTGYLDPIPLLTRTFTIVLYPLFVLAFDAIFSLLIALPLIGDASFSLHESLRGVILPIHLITFKNMVIIFLVFTGILLATKISRRFWCKYLCPLGALLGVASIFRLYRRNVSDACTECSLCARKCRMNAISNDGKSTEHAECINCMDCQKVCPTGAVSFRLGGKTIPVKPDISRRRLLIAGVAGLLTAGIFRSAMTSVRKKGWVVRPPGAMEEDKFLDRCVRCGECIRVCSTSGGGLQYSSLEGGFEGIWTPILDPYTGYCEYNCNMCGQVCPTGAIHPLPLKERQKMIMGIAHFNKTRCIPWYYGENCMVCEEHCPLPDKAIKFREEEVTTIDGRRNNILLPYVDEETCIGCGICVNKCPVEGERGIYLTNAEEYRWFD